MDFISFENEEKENAHPEYGVKRLGRRRRSKRRPLTDLSRDSSDSDKEVEPSRPSSPVEPEVLEQSLRELLL